MPTLLTTGTIACVMLAAWWIVEGLRLFLRYRPVTGILVDHSYTDAQKVRDRTAHPMDRLAAWDPHAIKATVSDTLRVRYKVDGRDYEQVIRSGHMRGVSADSVRTLWYDPGDPSRVLRNGPGNSFAGAAAVLFFALLIWTGGH